MKNIALLSLSIIMFCSCVSYNKFQFQKVYKWSEEYRQKGLAAINNYDDLPGTLWLKDLSGNKNKTTIFDGLFFMGNSTIFIVNFWAERKVFSAEINPIWCYSYSLRNPEFSARYEIKNDKLVILDDLICYLDKENKYLYFNGNSEDIAEFDRYIFYTRFSVYE
ncbi:hypothetical protein FACS1894130_13250 [Spirochaetia bacterium]|nr:hypothetical protein FACS1894130_13250 [Spirochaetia bacterium]